MRRDPARVLDMLIYARRALAYAEGVGFESFSSNRMQQDGIIRALEVIGEAARGVSESFRREHPEVPWAQMSGLRNVIAHEYFRVDLAKIWDIIQNDLPRLIELIEPLVPPPRNASS